MIDDNVFKLNKSEHDDPLQGVLREGARKMRAAAIEAEVSIPLLSGMPFRNR